MESFTDIFAYTHPLSGTCWQMELNGVLNFFRTTLVGRGRLLESLVGVEFDTVIRGPRLVPKSVLKWIEICTLFINKMPFLLLLKQSSNAEN
jgi:hypothetical protein